MSLTSFSRSHWPFGTKILIEKGLCGLEEVWVELGVGNLISIAYYTLDIRSISGVYSFCYSVGLLVPPSVRPSIQVYVKVLH